MQKKILGVLLLLLFGLTAFAQKNNFQEAYWINTAGEKVKGFINPYIQNDGLIKARTESRTASLQRLDPQQIREIWVDNRPLFYAESLERPSGTHYFFVKALLYGEISLYAGKANNFGKAFFIVQDDGKRLLINKNAPEYFLSTLFPDCSQALSNLFIRYAQESLLKALKIVNECVDGNTDVIIQEDAIKIPPVFSVGGKLTYNLGKMQTREPPFYPAKFDFDNVISGQFFANWTFKNNFMIQAGMGYIKKEVMERIQLSRFSFFDMNASFTYLELPLTVGYKLPLQKLEPYALGGINVGLLLDAEWDRASRGVNYSNFEAGAFGEIGILILVEHGKFIASATYINSETHYRFIHENGGGTFNLLTERLMVGLGYMHSF